MRVSYKWLRDYVDFALSPGDLADRLTLIGLAVEGIIDLGRGIQRVYTGRILSIDPHPNADRLTVCSVTTGGSDPIQIVTGATNVSVGDVVPVAVEGAKLANGLTIKKSKLRGVESRGMMCSGNELGLDPKTMPLDQAHGIMILPAGTPPGQDIMPMLGLDDYILELELTPNRGDCLSMVGVAREVAALLGTALKIPEPACVEMPRSIAGRARVDIIDPSLCRRYVAKMMTNIKIGPSPLWLQQRLRAAGVRPISNIVDLTNYVLMELGQPLHAFDYDRLVDGHIIVRRAEAGETIVSLDNAERRLTTDMLVIADPSGPVAVAGVMGGLSTEVTAETTNILLESAWFDPVSIRRTSRDLGLRSESSIRFEKGIDIDGCLRAADRVAQLVQELGIGEIVAGAADNYPLPGTEKTILLRPARVAHVLGQDISRDEEADILERLQFRVQKDKENLMVTVPTHRPDIALEEDLIEEVARMYGYDRIPGALPTGVTTRGARTSHQVFMKRIKEVMVSCGFDEVITYSFISPRVFERIGLPEDSPLRETVNLMNPLSEEQSVMRTLLYPGLLEVLQRNYSRRVADGAIFELGSVFYPRPGELLPAEKPCLAAAVTGKAPGGWAGPGAPLDYFYLKGALEAVLAVLGAPGPSFPPLRDRPGFHPGRTATVEVDGKEVGFIGELHPGVQEQLELPQRVVCCELDLEVLASAAGETVRYSPLPRYPSVERDLAVVVGREVPAGDVLDVLYKAAGPLLKSVELFDVYTGEQVKQGCRSLAFALRFQAEDRTLTDGEVVERLKIITEALATSLGAEMRV
ncbi:MAG: phenylalanine--tRNA ligase subunit beta [Bacillota bacterium]